jgi:hypothetical protein
LSTETMPTPWRSANSIAAAMARYATDWPSLRFAFQIREALKRDGLSSITAPGTHPWDPLPKRWSR